MKAKFQLIFFLLFAFLSSCKKENRCDCIKRTGTIIREERSLSGFDKIAVENNLNVFITQDSAFKVTVEAGENIAPLIETVVQDGTLIMRNKNRCNWARSYQKPLNVYVAMPELRYVTSDGTGDIKSLNTLTTSTIDLQIKNSGNIELTVDNKVVLSHMHGSGDVTLHGNTEEHDISIGGTAYIYAADLQTSYTFIDKFTLGMSYIRVRDLLICKMKDKGDVICYGNPTTVHKTIEGSGQLYFK
ncbi:MAG: hypothetical protein K0Q95_3267 [Bacteroidota bacterium]|jgi:hypothetical protein|nr:hypothetical protein [Bacteroidota bacterium]